MGRLAARRTKLHMTPCHQCTYLVLPLRIVAHKEHVPHGAKATQNPCFSEAYFFSGVSFHSFYLPPIPGVVSFRWSNASFFGFFHPLELLKSSAGLLFYGTEPGACGYRGSAPTYRSSTRSPTTFLPDTQALGFYAFQCDLDQMVHGQKGVPPPSPSPRPHNG